MEDRALLLNLEEICMGINNGKNRGKYDKRII